ncbi:hypothetical protein Tco_1393342 [Tanacetum coccineum]
MCRGSISVKAYRIYNKRTRKIQETVHVAFDELTEGLTSVQTSSGLAPQQMTSVPNSTELELTALQSGRSRSALVKDPEPPSVPPTKKQVDDLFQWFDDDEVVPDTRHRNVFDTYNAPETGSEASSSNSVNIDVTPNNQLPHVQKWTQAHPLENIIGDKDRPVSTRKQLETDAMWCFFNEFLTHVEPKTYKQALEHSQSSPSSRSKWIFKIKVGCNMRRSEEQSTVSGLKLSSGSWINIRHGVDSYTLHEKEQANIFYWYYIVMILSLPLPTPKHANYLHLK